MTSGSEAAETVSNKRGTLWEDREVDALIAVWGEEGIQAKLDGATRNIKFFKAIAQKLKDLGLLLDESRNSPSPCSHYRPPAPSLSLASFSFQGTP